MLFSIVLFSGQLLKAVIYITEAYDNFAFAMECVGLLLHNNPRLETYKNIYILMVQHKKLKNENVYVTGPTAPGRHDTPSRAIGDVVGKCERKHVIWIRVGLPIGQTGITSLHVWLAVHSARCLVICSCVFSMNFWHYTLSISEITE